MRKPALALLCGLVAAVALALLVGRVDDERAQRSIPSPPKAASAASMPALVSPPPLQQGPALVVQRSASAPAAAAPASAAARAEGTPFALSSDHKALVQEASIAAADLQRLEQEPRDDGWAAEAERLIRVALAGHAGFAGFDIVAVDCRSTLCAVQAFSYGEEGNRQWVRALDDVYKASLVDLFDSINTAFPTQAGRAAVLTFLHRKPAATPR